MTQWKQTLTIGNEFELAQSGVLKPCKLAGVIAKKLGELDPYRTNPDVEIERLRLVDEFGVLSEMDDLLEDDFDEVMEQLYDWADTPIIIGYLKTCWINTVHYSD